MLLSFKAQSAALLYSTIALATLAPVGNAWSAHYKVLHSFVAGMQDGANPTAPVILHTGNLYGTTVYGGGSGLGPGVVFKLALDGTETLLHIFNYTDEGYGPEGGLILDPVTGEFYGSTTAGGAYKGGVLFKLDKAGSETVLHNFDPVNDGSFPSDHLIRDAQGNFYGIAGSGGGDRDGTVYELAADGSFKVLHTFVGTDGEDPAARLERDQAGNLSGTTYFGGANNAGTVFKLTPSGTLTTLHSFSGGSDGARPIGGLLRDKAGNLYGTTNWGGAANLGVFFRMASDGTETVIHDFAGGADGGQPEGDLLRIHGTFYGTTGRGGGACDCGTVFKMSADGTETILHRFHDSDGANPYAGLIIDKRGVFYGTTANGGAHGRGVVFRLKT